jgi:hypothetical protein
MADLGVRRESQGWAHIGSGISPDGMSDHHRRLSPTMRATPPTQPPGKAPSSVSAALPRPRRPTQGGPLAHPHRMPRSTPPAKDIGLSLLTVTRSAQANGAEQLGEGFPHSLRAFASQLVRRPGRL